MVYISAKVVGSGSPSISKAVRCPKEEGVAVKTCPFLCGKEGVELLKKDIADEGVNTLVIAACSRRVLMMSSALTAASWTGST